MGFESKEMIIGAPLVLNELPKYRDKIKIQSTLVPYRNFYFYFWLQYLLLWWMGQKFQSDSTLAEIKIFSVLATVLLWCMGLRKISTGIWPTPEKQFIICGCNTIMVHGIYKSSNWYLTLTEQKILLFLATLQLWCKYQLTIELKRISFQFFFSATAQWYMGIGKAFNEIKASPKNEGTLTGFMPNGRHHYHISIL